MTKIHSSGIVIIFASSPNRIKEIRNALHHVASNELDEYHFKVMWTTVATALRRLGTTEQELDSYKQIDLDPDTTRMYIYEVKQQAIIDHCGHMEVSCD